MLYRNVIEQLEPDSLKYDCYVFVGFNVLNKVETHFFQQLQNAGKALFYWDYDVFYTQLPSGKNNAMRPENLSTTNLKLFPNELPAELFNELIKPKKVRFISSPTERTSPLSASMGT